MVGWKSEAWNEGQHDRAAFRRIEEAGPQRGRMGDRLGSQAISLQKLLAASQGNASLLEVLQQIQATATTQAAVTGTTAKTPLDCRSAKSFFPSFPAGLCRCEHDRWFLHCPDHKS